MAYVMALDQGTTNSRAILFDRGGAALGPVRTGRHRRVDAGHDGGAAANDALMQFQADILHVPVVRPNVLETTAPA